MKHNFMNKENGKIASVLVMYLDDDGHMQTDGYDKVEDLLEDYAAYGPAKPEPLIKDEKIRKAVRAWAEACDVEKCHYEGDGDFATRWHGIKLDCSQIELDEGFYTIAELCGEDEE